MELAWCTDIHLDCVEDDGIATFADGVRAVGADGLLVTGDVSLAALLVDHLVRLADLVAMPVYFVLGNHDFYGDSIEAVRERVRELCARHARLRWLPEAGVVELDGDAALVGVDGWGDGRLGNGRTTRVELNDFFLIRDLADLEREPLLERLAAFGDAEAAALEPLLHEACARYKQVHVATHVPPFREACWYQGSISSDDWLPWFTCDAVGRLLREAAAEHPGCHLTVWCGHTHGEGTAQIADNLEVHTGAARYGAPALCGSVPAHTPS